MDAPFFFAGAAVDEVRKILKLGSDAPTGKGVRVAVLDTGLDMEHEDLKGRVDVRASANCVSGSRRSLVDIDGHGTHIAGIIAGTGAAGGRERRGIAPDATLVILRVGARRTADGSDFAKGVELAIEAGVDILNYSFGTIPACGHAPWSWGPGSIFDRALEDASAQGVLCVVAAGNEGPREGSVTRPGGWKSVLTVGALDGTVKPHRVLQGSSRGPYRQRNAGATAAKRYDAKWDRDFVTIAKPDLVAPGVRIFSTRCGYADTERDRTADGANATYLDPLDDQCPYHCHSGSSQATAVVSGVASLMLQLCRDRRIDLGPNPGHTIARLMCVSALPLEHGTPEDFGHGQLFWPNIAASIADFATDDVFRSNVLNRGHLQPM